MITPEQFQKSLKDLSLIIDRQMNVSYNVGIDPNMQKTLLSEMSHLKNSTLKVLVMGQFDSGKSTFLNALMGQELLSAKVTPTTAVIGEIGYGTKPRAILYPKDNNKKPFEIDIMDLPKYTVIDHSVEKDDVKAKISPYEKVVIKYPLDICKMGIELIDSPGTNDPSCHDRITQEYLPKADAIIYLMNVQTPFDLTDKVTLDNLVAKGYKSIIFVLTYFDILEESDRKYGTNQVKEAVPYVMQKLSGYTTLGTEGIFFVGSLPALKAKERNDMAMLEASHLPVVEKKLKQILFNEKGRMKLAKALYAAKMANRECNTFVANKIAVAQASRNKQSSDLVTAQGKLEKARQKAQEISKQFSEGLDAIVKDSKNHINLFITNDIIPNIPSWVSDFQPAEGQSISILHPNRTGAVFTEACVTFLQTKIETAMGTWCEKTLVAKVLNPRINALAESQNANLDAFENDLSALRNCLSLKLNLDANNEQSKVQSGKANRIFAALTSLALTDVGGAFVGGQLGFAGLGQALIAQLIGGIILVIASLFTPIGWVAIITTNIVAALIGGFSRVQGVEERVKKNIGQEAQKELSNRVGSIVSGVVDGLQMTMNKMKDAVQEDIDKPVKNAQNLLDEARKNQTLKENEITANIEKYMSLQNENNKITNDLDGLAEKNNI